MPEWGETRPLAMLAGSDPAEAGLLSRALAPRLEAVVAPAELGTAIAVEDAAASCAAVLDWLGGRRLGAAVVAPSPQPVTGIDDVVGALRGTFLWMRALTAALAEGEGGLLLVPLRPVGGDELAARTLESGLIGLTKTTGVSLSDRGVRCLPVRRGDGDAALFARLTAVLASPALDWLSGHLLASSASDVSLLTPDEPLWELFAEPVLCEGWLGRIEAMLRDAPARPGNQPA
jgi:hypothetical protein